MQRMQECASILGLFCLYTRSLLPLYEFSFDTCMQRMQECARVPVCAYEHIESRSGFQACMQLCLPISDAEKIPAELLL